MMVILRLLLITLLTSTVDQSLVATSSCPSGQILVKESDAKITITGVLRILAIGSSSTAGSGASNPTKTYPYRLRELLRARYPKIDIDVVNAGVNGETVGDASHRLQNLLLVEHYDMIIWQLGTNDAIQGADETEFKKYVVAGATAARAADTPLILMDPQWYPSIRDPDRYRKYVIMIEHLADELGLMHLHRYDLMRSWEKAKPSHYSDYMAQDGFHLGDLGYECLSREIVKSTQHMIQIRPEI